MARKRRPLNESVFFESLLWNIKHGPGRARADVHWGIERMGLRVWRIKNVDIPYRKKLKEEKRREAEKQRNAARKRKK